jgi:hypothetical protein
MEKNLVQYAGRLNSEVRIQLLDLLKVVSLSNLTGRNDVKRLCSIALELLDNAQRYGSSEDISFDWHIEGDQLVVRITNRANRADAERLMKTVDEINGMTAEEVAAAFRAQLTNQTFGEKGGAGLGMLQIAKRSSGRIQARIEPLDHEHFLCISHVAATLR